MGHSLTLQKPEIVKLETKEAYYPLKIILQLVKSHNDIKKKEFHIELGVT